MVCPLERQELTTGNIRQAPRLGDAARRGRRVRVLYHLGASFGASSVHRPHIRYYVLVLGAEGMRPSALGFDWDPWERSSRRCRRAMALLTSATHSSCRDARHWQASFSSILPPLRVSTQLVLRPLCVLPSSSLPPSDSLLLSASILAPSSIPTPSPSSPLPHLTIIKLQTFQLCC